MRTRHLHLLLWAGLALQPVLSEDDALPVKVVERDQPVDFASEVLPFLKRNCLACHNETKAKADLILETPAAMLKGGDGGPAVIPGKADDSLVFLTAAHLDDPVMPPPKNKSKARNLSPLELGLLKKWIDEGAEGEVHSIPPAPEKWLRDPDHHTILAIAVSPDDRFVAFGRGHAIELYDLKKRLSLGSLRHPDLDFGAHRDVVHSLAFSPDGTLASGGFRVIQLWRRPDSEPAPFEGEFPAPDPAIQTNGTDATLTVGENPITLKHDAPIAHAALSGDRGYAAFAGEKGTASLWLVDGKKKVTSLDLAPRDQRQLESLKREEAVSNRLVSLHKTGVTNSEKALEEEKKLAAELADAVAGRERELQQAKESKDPEADKDASIRKATASLESARRNSAAAAEKVAEAEAGVEEAGKILEETTRKNEELKAKTAALSREIASARSSAEITGMAFSPDDSEILVALRSGWVHLYAASTGEYLESIPTGTELTAMTVVGNRMVTRSSKDEMHSWPLDRSFRMDGRIGDGDDGEMLVDRVTALAFDPAGDVLVSGSGIATRRGSLKSWDPRKGTLLAENPKAHRDTITSIRFSPSGEALVTGSTDKFAKVFSTKNLELRMSLESHTGHVLGVDWSRDGQTIVTAGSDTSLKLWDVSIGEVKQAIKRGDHEVVAVRFASPANDNLIAAFGDRTVKLNATAYPEQEEFQALALTHDGKKTIAGGENGRLIIWDSASRKMEVSLEPGGDG